MGEAALGMTEREPELGLGADEERLSLGGRRDARFTLHADVTVESDHNFYAGFAENLSVSGVFVATHTEHRVGDRVAFKLRIGDSEEPLRGIGEVRWVRQYSETSDAPPGVGLRFLELEEVARRKIGEFLTGRDPLFFDDDDL
jgi:uncharacterized protein (TIGR02266 family)